LIAPPDWSAAAFHAVMPHLDDGVEAARHPASIGWPQWLGEEPANEVHLKALLAPYPSEERVCWPVSPRVGNVKNNDPDLVEPIHLP
jgi:hypothetical protein